MGTLKPFHTIGQVSPSTLSAGGQSYEIFPLDGAERLPYTLRILLENALRHGEEEDAEALRRWQPAAAPSDEISFRPARVLLQDFTGVPAVVDLAGMRDAMADLGGDPSRINPCFPPSSSSTTRCRSTSTVGTRDVPQRRAGVRAQSRALRLSTLGPDGLRQLQGRAAEHRHRAPGQPRVPRARDRGARRPWRSPTRSSAPTRTPR